PLVTCTVEGSLLQLGTAWAPSEAQAPLKASPENWTWPVGTPGMTRTELAPGVTSKVCDVVREAAAVRRMQPTSAGTVVTATRTTPTSSGLCGDPQPATWAAARRTGATTSRTPAARERRGNSISASGGERRMRDTSRPRDGPLPVSSAGTRFFLEPLCV